MEAAELTHVDRIDTSKIHVCGHNLPVSKAVQLGVTVFHHPDGRPCSLLNSLRLDGDAVNREDSHFALMKKNTRNILDLLDDASCYARLPTDKELAGLVAKQLDAERDPESLTQALLKIARCKHAVETFRAIREALTPGKQRILMKNILVIFTKQYTDGTATDVSHLYPLIIEAQNIFSSKNGETNDEKRQRG
jgi:hypothetical protein